MKKITALFTALALIAGLCACTAKSELATWQEQYDLGVRYLSEGNYEEAIIAFNAAIEIDPKRADTYIGLADVYVALGDAERAGQVLEDALTAVSDPDIIQSRLDALGGGEPEPTPGPTPSPAPGSNSDFVIEDGDLVEYTGPGGAVTIPDGVTSIGDYAFFECTNLTSVSIGNGITIGAYAFAHCINLTSVSIGNNATIIGAYAFADCTNLTSVSIGNGATTIGAHAFDGCSSLTNVYYSGSKARWDQINIGEGNDPLFNATIHFNS